MIQDRSIFFTSLWMGSGGIFFKTFCFENCFWSAKIFLIFLAGSELRAAWTCRLGCTTLGYSTYVPNSMESAHRALKTLLPGNWKTRDSAGAIIEVSKVVASRVQQGFYSGDRGLSADHVLAFTLKPVLNCQRTWTGLWISIMLGVFGWDRTV